MSCVCAAYLTPLKVATFDRQNCPFYSSCKPIMCITSSCYKVNYDLLGLQRLSDTHKGCQTCDGVPKKAQVVVVSPSSTAALTTCLLTVGVLKALSAFISVATLVTSDKSVLTYADCVQRAVTHKAQFECEPRGRAPAMLRRCYMYTGQHNTS